MIQLVGIFVLAMGYSILRYLVLGDADPQNTPVYLLNKGLAFSTMAHFVLLCWAKLRHQEENVVFWGKAILHFSLLHAAFSSVMISPLYYPGWFSWQKMNWTGELATLFGVIALYLMLVKVWMKDAYLKYLSWNVFHFILIVLVGAHILSLGLVGWLRPEKWHGELPPISLISFGVFGIAFILSLLTLFARKRTST